MDSQSLLNGLKDLFASLGAKTSDSNYAVGLFDKTTKEPKGVMGMSDLASVLGVSSKVDGGLLKSGGLGSPYPCDYGTAIKFTSTNPAYNIFLVVEMTGSSGTGKVWFAIDSTVTTNTVWKRVDNT